MLFRLPLAARRPLIAFAFATAALLPPDDPAFHDHYRDVGSFPGTDGPTTNEALIRPYKAVGAPLTPVL